MSDDWDAYLAGLAAEKRLRDAAPDMLAALRLAARAFDTLGVSNGAVRDAVKAIRAAIAQAEGRA